MQGNRAQDPNLELFSLANYIEFIFSICTMLMVQTIYVARLEKTLETAAKFTKSKCNKPKYTHILHVAAQALRMKYYAKGV